MSILLKNALVLESCSPAVLSPSFIYLWHIKLSSKISPFPSYDFGLSMVLKPRNSDELQRHDTGCRGCRLTAWLSPLTSHVWSIKLCCSSALFSKAIFLNISNKSASLPPWPGLYFTMQTSTMNVNDLDQHYSNCEAFGLLLPWAPQNAQNSISTAASSSSAGRECFPTPLPSQNTFPGHGREVCASLHSPRENETKSWHCCSLRRRSLE